MQQEEHNELRALRALEELMQMELGRELVEDLLRVTGMELTGFSGDPYQDAYMAGKRHIGVCILTAVRSMADGLRLEKLMREESRQRARDPTDANGKQLGKPFYDLFI